jgi:hypothetical protein
VRFSAKAINPSRVDIKKRIPVLLNKAPAQLLSFAYKE